MATTLKIPLWAAFNPVSNSLAARSTVLLPLIGYLIIFNETVVKYLNLVTSLGGVSHGVLEVSPRLLLIYFGLCAIAAGVTLYSIFCPNGIKFYGSANAYVGNVQNSVKMFAYSDIEQELKKSAYKKQYELLRISFDSQIEQLNPTPENRLDYANGLLHIYYAYLNNSFSIVRCVILVFYAVGFICLAIPSAGVFWRICRILWSIASTQFSLLF